MRFAEFKEVSEAHPTDVEFAGTAHEITAWIPERFCSAEVCSEGMLQQSILWASEKSQFESHFESLSRNAAPKLQNSHYLLLARVRLLQSVLLPWPHCQHNFEKPVETDCQRLSKFSCGPTKPTSQCSHCAPMQADQ